MLMDANCRYRFSVCSSSNETRNMLRLRPRKNLPKKEGGFITITPCCVLISVTLAFCLIAGVLVLIYQGHMPGTEQERHTECGASLAEFKANGCTFYLLSYTWMPARCKDPSTSADFSSWLSDPQRHLGPWPFFKNRTVGSSLTENRITSEVEFGNRWDMDIWSSMEEHLAHCMFLFLHVSRVAVGEALLRTSDTFAHAEHCFHAIWKGLNGTWNLNEDRKEN
jgi:hypothetical protein